MRQTDHINTQQIIFRWLFLTAENRAFARVAPLYRGWGQISGAYKAKPNRLVILSHKQNEGKGQNIPVFSSPGQLPKVADKNGR